MGRAFEYRKARKLKRWGNMARTFTRIGKEIDIAVKAGGPDPANNTRLRILIKTPRLKICRRRTSKELSNAPFQKILLTTRRLFTRDTVFRHRHRGRNRTDNNTRTVANVRHCFNKYGGSLGTTGSLDFLLTGNACSKLPARRTST